MWRNTALRAEMFPGVDGRVVIAMFIWLLHLAVWTFCVFVSVAAFFWLINRKGYSMGITMLRIRRFIVGNVRPKWSAHEYCARRLPGDMIVP